MRWVRLSCVGVTLVLTGLDRPEGDRVVAKTDAAVTARISQTYGRLPLRFEANRGQTDPRVDLLARGPGYTLFLSAAETVVALSHGDQPAVLRLGLVDANQNAQVAATGELPGTVNHFIGNDPARWRVGIPTYSKVTYRDVYPGIDVAYYGNHRQLEYDFIVAPGADSDAIRLRVDGADGIAIDDDGGLVLRTAAGDLRQEKPTIYQELDGHRIAVDGGYVLRNATEVAFTVASYDPTRPLVIDPTFAYSTFLGGSVTDDGERAAIAVGASGAAFVAGNTTTSDFPASAGAFDSTLSGGQDGYVAKLSPDGSTLLYATYFGGSNFDGIIGLAIDASGAAYFSGRTLSSDLPTTSGAFSTSFHAGSGTDAFAAKLSADGSALAYSTYLGGSATDAAYTIRVDAAGAAYVVGFTDSSNFPTTAGAFDTARSGTDGFLVKVAADGTSLAYSTFIGGSSTEFALGVALDGSGAAYVTGETFSGDFPVTAGAADTTLGGGSDAYIIKFAPDGSAAAYASLLGGSGGERGERIAVDPTGAAYVTGATSSNDLSVTAGAFDTSFNGGGRDVFVAKMAPGGGALVFATYLGGAGDEEAFGIAIDTTGAAHVTGRTASGSFPTMDAIDASYNGAFDVFLTKFTASGAALAFSTFIGGVKTESGYAIAVDGTGAAYVTGTTFSGDFPTTPGAVDTTHGGNGNVFVVKIGLVGPPAALTLNPPAAINPVGSEHCVTATVEDAAGNAVADVTVLFTVIGAAAASGSAATDAAGHAQFCYTGPATTGADAITAFADTDNDETQDLDEPAGKAGKTWVAGPPATLTLDPPAATNPVDSDHCVTATVADASANAVPDVTVRFSVTGSVEVNGSAPTDANGHAMFCYAGPPLPGADAITAFADADGDSLQDAGEPSGAATKTWTLPVTTASCGVTYGGRMTTVNGADATFGGNAMSARDGAPRGQQQYQDHGTAQRMNMHSITVMAIVCEGSMAARIYGQATIDGAGRVDYRIRVTDVAEPGVGHDTYELVLQNGYSSGELMLQGGNVQIRRR